MGFPGIKAAPHDHLGLNAGARKRVDESNVLARLRDVGMTLGGLNAGGCWMARCPAHDDREPSLSISTGDQGRVLFTSPPPLHEVTR